MKVQVQPDGRIALNAGRATVWLVGPEDPGYAELLRHYARADPEAGMRLADLVAGLWNAREGDGDEASADEMAGVSEALRLLGARVEFTGGTWCASQRGPIKLSQAGVVSDGKVLRQGEWVPAGR